MKTCAEMRDAANAAKRAAALGKLLAQPTVEYAVTVPGLGGTVGAFGAEVFMAALLMGVVLWTSNRSRWEYWTSYLVGALIVNYIFFFAPVSGFSINPARTVGSAVFAGVWTAWWVYFVAPMFGMLGVAELYLRLWGKESVRCAKVHQAATGICPFDCRVPGHRHAKR
jgi:aquaporin Z